MKRNIILAAILLLVISAGAVYIKRPTSPAPGGNNTETPLEESFVRLGQSKTIDGVTIKPLEVVEDSRCAAGLQCIWAGTVKVKVNLSKPSGNFTEVLELGKSISTGTERVELIAVAPDPKAGVKIAPADYKFTFKVTPVPAMSENPGTGGCYVGGCSGQICSDERGAVSTCEWTEAYACYSTAKCERQATGKCGWTETPQLKMCIQEAGSTIHMK